jgi:hypothetical protein
MLLIVKILFLQSVMVGFQSSSVLLWCLYYSLSNPHTFGYSGFFITLLLRFLYYSLFPLFLFFFPLNLTYLLITKDYRKRKTLMSLSLEYHSHTLSITQVGQPPPFSNTHPLTSLQTSLSTRTLVGVWMTCLVV